MKKVHSNSRQKQENVTKKEEQNTLVPDWYQCIILTLVIWQFMQNETLSFFFTSSYEIYLYKDTFLFHLPIKIDKSLMIYTHL